MKKEVSGFWFLVSGLRFLVSCFWFELGTWNLEPETCPEGLA
jgi:hypothetical protein